MDTTPTAPIPARQRGSSVLTVGFGSAVAMWAVGYLGRLPGLQLPSAVLLVLMLACIPAGGWALGRLAGLGWRHGALAGLVTGTINLLILGSLLAGERPNQIVPSALIWLPGSILLASALAASGALIGGRRFRTPYDGWVAAFVRVDLLAMLLLLVAGGLVTTQGAGLAVVDWPNSFGYNMFLYPFSRMTGGIYYEHAHRLFGALVGLTTLVLAVLLQLCDRRRFVRVLGWTVFAAVCFQGLLGGLRVTGGFTLSTSPEAMRPNLALAMVHGIFAQLVFGCLVALVAFTSRRWTGPARATSRASARWDRVWVALLTALLLGQLVLGAAQRHFGALLVVHIAFGVALVAPAALHVGFRAWGANDEQPLLQRLGLALAAAVALQVVLGLGAFLAVRVAEEGGIGPAGRVLLRTVHQGFGAVLFGLVVTLGCWSYRLLSPGPEKTRKSGLSQNGKLASEGR